MQHPRIDEFDSLTRPDRSAHEMGYRLPAEWEPQRRVWLKRPRNRETWPNCLEQAQAEHDDWMAKLRDFVEVVPIGAVGIPAADGWIRDYGPIFVVAEDGRSLACHDFRFNSWGGKYEYRPDDDLVPQRIALEHGLPIWVHDFVLEGGSIDPNGAGALLTTRQCLLNTNRNPHLNPAQIEAILEETLGITRVIWLAGALTGDDTDGHVDVVARFVAEDRVVTLTAPHGHPDHAVLDLNHKALRETKFDIIEVPVPEPIWYDYPPDRYGPGGRAMVPAGYANFLITNGAVFVPTFGQRADDAALRLIDDAMPAHTVVPIPSNAMIVGGGSLHCLSMQQPGVKQ